MSKLHVKLTERQLKDLVHKAYCAGHKDAMDDAYPDVGFTLGPGTFNTHWDKLKSALPGVVSYES